MEMRPRCAEGWNFGPVDEDAKPVQWIVEQLTAQWGEGASWQLDGNPQPHEAHLNSTAPKHAPN